jgi:hypothetical protein
VSDLANAVKAVLFDWGDTLMEFAYDTELVAAGHRAGLEAIGRGELPASEAVTELFRERYEPFFWQPGTIEELEYPGLVRELLGHFGVGLDDEELGRFLEAEHAAWAPARRPGAATWHGGTQGSPVDPLLCTRYLPATGGLRSGEARLRPPAATA